MRSSLLAVASTVLVLVTLPAVAGADPGSAAVDQYRENIPSDAGRGRDAKAPRTPTAARKSLEAAGQDGRALAEVLNAGAGPANGSDDVSGTSRTSGDGAGAPTSRSDDGPGAPTSGPGDGGRGASDGAGGRSASGSAAAGDGNPSAAATTAGRAAADTSTAGSAVEAGVAASIGPVPLWVALAAVAVGSIGLAVVRRARP